MKIRYKKDHGVVRDVEPQWRTHSTWMGPHQELYSCEQWEGVPEEKWVPSEISLISPYMLVVSGTTLTIPDNVRITMVGPGTIKLERKVAA